MIAHSGFTHFPKKPPEIPYSLDEFLDQNVPEIADPAADPYGMGVGKNYPTGQWGKPWFADALASLAPAPAEPHFVPMEIHLEHLELTGKTERWFGIKIGYYLGLFTSALIAGILKHFHLFQ